MNTSKRTSFLPAFTSVAVLFVLLCFLSLFNNNVVGNEVTKFTDSKAFIDPSWIPNYHSQAQSPFHHTRLLFRTLLSPLLTSCGFLTISIVGRLACYALLAFAFVRLGQVLRLGLPALALAVMLFYFKQDVAARESIISGFEPKVISYGLVLLALSLALQRTSGLKMIAVLLGVACSFHILISFYAALAFAGLFLYQRRLKDISVLDAAWSVVLFLAGASFALLSAFNYLRHNTLEEVNSLAVSPTFLYVFVRTPHHLDPSFWPSGWERFLVGYLFLAAASFMLLVRASPVKSSEDLKYAWTSLLVFTGCALLPFFAGLLISGSDHEGVLLKFYLFRFGDSMLPLAACLLAAGAVEHVACARMHLLRKYDVCQLILSCICLGLVVWRVPVFIDQYRTMLEFPIKPGRVSQEFVDCTQWVQENTAVDSVFIVPPRIGVVFPWLARRKIYGSFKQVELAGGLQQWYSRMSDLALTDHPWPVRGFHARNWLERRYYKLKTGHVLSLLQKHQMDYFVTVASHKLDLPIAFGNSGYTVYRAPEQTAPDYRSEGS